LILWNLLENSGAIMEEVLAGREKIFGKKWKNTSTLFPDLYRLPDFPPFSRRKKGSALLTLFESSGCLRKWLG
jgi:hypothetical protein